MAGAVRVDRAVLIPKPAMAARRSGWSGRLGGASYSTVYIDSNGKLNFMFPESDYLNVSLPNPYQGYSHVVFAWWDDLRPIPDTPGNVASLRRSPSPVIEDHSWSLMEGDGTHAKEGSMLEGVILLWFVLTAAALLFVAVDIRNTPESPVLKWGFVLLTAYTGVVGGFLYVLGCREPLPGLHERYVAARWRQALGSTMHCVAGDGVGILVGAILASLFGLTGLSEVIVEYVLGFAFGWTIFQALFMRDMAGGSYPRALSGTFTSELLSMNLLMTGMVPTVMALRSEIAAAADPTTPAFWFVMSMGLLLGFIVAYPMNWWLVANHLKHGMMTVRPAAADVAGHDHGAHAGATGSSDAVSPMSMSGAAKPRPPVPVMALLSFVALAAGVAIGFPLRPT